MQIVNPLCACCPDKLSARCSSKTLRTDECRETSPEEDSASNLDNDDLDLLGISLHYLKYDLLAEVRAASFDYEATIHDIAPTTSKFTRGATLDELLTQIDDEDEGILEVVAE